MSVSSFFLLALLLCSACSRKEPVQLIFDTDCGPDYDDVGALAVMYALEAQGACSVLAVVSSNLHEDVIPTIDVINTFYGRSDVLLGETKGEGVSIEGWHKESWAKFLIHKYKPTKRSGASIADAVKIYRRVLAEAKDGSVVICTVGFLTNLNNLLHSHADEISSLTGKELVAQKVKRLVAMACGFPEGDEFNVKEDTRSAIGVATAFPSPIYFCGFEVGEKVITGKLTAEMAVENDPVADAYRVALPQDDPKGRNSWDQVTVLAAVKGTAPYFRLVEGRVCIYESGRNGWMDDPAGEHYYMVPIVPHHQLADEIERLMMKR